MAQTDSQHAAQWSAPVQVTMRRAEVDPTRDQALWVVIRNSADAMSFDNYAAFIEPIMCRPAPPAGQQAGSTRRPRTSSCRSPTRSPTACSRWPPKSS